VRTVAGPRAKPASARSSSACRRFWTYGAVALIAASCGGDSSQPRSTQDPLKFINKGLQQSQVRANAVSGATARQRSLLRSLIRSIDGKAIRRVTVSRPPSGWRGARRLRASGDTWLTIHVQTVHDPFSELTALWKAYLLAGAFRDRARSEHVATVLGFTEVLEYPGGQRRRNSQLMTGPFTHQVSTAAVDSLARTLRAKFERIDEVGEVERVEVSFVRPFHLAPRIDVVAKKPLIALQHLENLGSLKLEGWLLRIRDSDGEPGAIRSSAVRARLGGAWTRSSS
jgi:hypothetical protein